MSLGILNPGTPELDAYQAALMRGRQEQAQGLQELQGLLSIKNIVEKQQQQEKLRGLLAQSGGDPEKAMQGVLAGGDVAAAQALAPLVRMEQERRQREETPRLLAQIYGGGATPAAGQPQQLGEGQPVAIAGEDAAPVAGNKMARIEQLKQMSLLPAFANNPVAFQRIQSEIDRLSKDEAAPRTRTRISGDQEIQEEFNTKTQSWTEVGRGPRFARQVAPVVSVTNAAPPQGDFTKTGDEYLNTLPVNIRNTVKGVANYEIDPKTFAARFGNRERVLEMVKQYNPYYDDTQYANKRRAIAQFGSGPQGNTVRSLNVAIEHIDTLQRAGEAMKNGSFVPGNAVYNEVAKVFGQTPPNTFEGIRDIVANEVVKGTIGNAGALQDRAEAAKKVRAAASPEQLNELMNGWVELMGGQVKGLEQQYSGSTGLKDFRNRYLTKRSLDAIALAESKAKPGGAPAAGGGWAIVR